MVLSQWVSSERHESNFAHSSCPLQLSQWFYYLYLKGGKKKSKQLLEDTFFSSQFKGQLFIIFFFFFWWILLWIAYQSKNLSRFKPLGLCSSVWYRVGLWWLLLIQQRFRSQPVHPATSYQALATHKMQLSGLVDQLALQIISQLTWAGGWIRWPELPPKLNYLIYDFIFMYRNHFLQGMQGSAPNPKLCVPISSQKLLDSKLQRNASYSADCLIRARLTNPLELRGASSSQHPKSALPR